MASQIWPVSYSLLTLDHDNHVYLGAWDRGLLNKC